MSKYKLIKKLPFEGSPDIGYISISDPVSRDGNSHYWNHNWFNPENHPEFWEKVVEKDYEILSFKGNKGKYEGVRLDKISSQTFCSPYRYDNLSEEYCLKEGFEIHSVKCLNNGKIFTIGDTVHYKNKSSLKWKIDNFFIREDGIVLARNKDCTMVEELNTIRQTKPIFITEDGKEIFEGDSEVYWVCYKVDYNCLNQLWEYGKVRKPFGLTDNTHVPEGYKYFSTKEAAEEYSIMNKPCLSINEVMNVAYNPTETFTSSSRKLKELVKQKIKNQ